MPVDDPDADDTGVSLDDMLEAERPDRLNHVVGDQPLPEDNESPATPLVNGEDKNLPSDHPSLDTDVDDDERYEGEI